MADQANSDAETSLTFSKEELQSMIESVVKSIVPQIVSKTVNGAMTDRQDKFEQKMLEQVKQTMVTKEEIAPAAKNNKKELDPEILALREQLDKLTTERESEKAQFRDKELRRQVSEELELSGMDKTKRKALMAQLILEDKVIGYGKDDKVVFKTKEGDLDKEYPLGYGLTNKFFTSEEGKSWLPPKDIKGSGSQPAKTALPQFDQETQTKDIMSRWKNPIG